MPVSHAILNGGQSVARDGSMGPGKDGADLRTLYEIWQEETGGGTFQDFLAALREPQETVQSQIVNPATGQPYDLLPAQVTDEQGKVPVRSALDNLSSGLSDLDGRSLYEQAQAAGYEGTEADFYAALVAQPDGGSGGSSWQKTEWDTQGFSNEIVIAEAGQIEFSVEFPFIHELNAAELALQVSMRVRIDADQRFWIYPSPSSNDTFAAAPETQRSIEAEFSSNSSSLDVYYRPVFKATRWAGGRADNTDEIRFYGTFKGDPGGATATISERRARFLYKPAPPL